MEHWEKTFQKNEDLFGNKPSAPARIAAALFQKEGVTNLLELGAGQGRDTLFFARQGIAVQALDYSAAGLSAIQEKADRLDVAPAVSVWQHDLRQPLPFADGTFDACFSHMLFCMAFTTAELNFLSREIWRVLKPGGLHVYTVRHTGDAHYGQGIHHGEDLYEMNGFIVHFFSREKVKQLANGFEIVGIEEFEEGPLPRKLFRVTMKKGFQMPSLEDAIALAAGAHQGQKDKAGAPYLLHPLRLMFQVETVTERIVAVLHDVIEDSAYSLEELSNMGYPPEIIAALDCLSRRENESYDAFIARVKTNPLARKVKRTDLEDNMDKKRLKTLTHKDIDRLSKYRMAWKSLK
mgnify:FL=1